MRKLFILALTIGLLACPANGFGDSQTSQAVYICTGAYAKTYHSKSNCRGMNACKGQIKKVTLSQAQKEGHRACKICY